MRVLKARLLLFLGYMDEGLHILFKDAVIMFVLGYYVVPTMFNCRLTLKVMGLLDYLNLIFFSHK